MTPANRRYLLMLPVVIVLLAASLFLARRPYYNWDIFPYMALAMAQPDKPFDSLHAAVYKVAQENMPRNDFKAISSRQPSLMKDPAAFEAILPYFEIKPGYNLLTRFLYSLGINPLMATWLPSIIGYFGLCLALFLWSAGKAPMTAAGLLTAIIATSPPMTDLARYSSPDMLGTFIFVFGVIMIVSERVQTGIALFTGALTFRPDAILLTVPIILALWRCDRLSIRQAAAWLVTGGAIVILLFARTNLIGQYLFLEFSLNERMAAYASGLRLVWQSYALPLAGLALVIIIFRRRYARPDLPSLLVWACLLSMTIRFLLHPFHEDRFNLSAYLTILIVGWETWSARVFTRDGLKPGKIPRF